MSERAPGRPRRAAILALGLGAGLAAAEAPSGDPAFGLWLTANGRAIVEIGSCDGGDAACGRIVWTAGQGGTCGRGMLAGLVRAAPGRWTGGTLTDPRDGTRYSAEIRAEGDSLTLRGYVGLPLFGRSQIWTRAADDRGGCGAARDRRPAPAPSPR